VESLTALVEHADGRLEVIDWADVAGVAMHHPRLAPAQAIGV
jgi:hypothetical protein